VTWHLKARIVDTEYTFITGQRLGKQVPSATNNQATIEVLLGYSDGKRVFCCTSPEIYNEDHRSTEEELRESLETVVEDN
jgi:hypothetical protein